jgi:hypothetical protein
LYVEHEINVRRQKKLMETLATEKVSIVLAPEKEKYN